MREVVDEIVDQPHVVIDIIGGKLYPVAVKNLVVREIDTKVKGNPDEHSQ